MLRGMTQRRVGDRLEQAIEHRADVPAELERGEQALEQEPAKGRGSLRRTIFWLAVSAVSLYLVAPSVIAALGSWRQIERLSPAWLAAMAALQGLALACLWILQLLSLREARWQPVIASQLAGNALAKIAPGGGAMGTALQYRMLVETGMRRGDVVSGLTAASLLVFGIVLALPVLSVPAILRGGVQRDLLNAALAGLAVFAVLFAARRVGAVLGPAAAVDRPPDPAHPQPAAPALRAAAAPAAAARRRARPHRRHARAALEARARRGARALGVRLRLPAGRAAGARRAAAARASCCSRSALRRCSPRSR